jgi:hypothetical protein
MFVDGVFASLAVFQLSTVYELHDFLSFWDRISRIEIDSMIERSYYYLTTTVCRWLAGFYPTQHTLGQFRHQARGEHHLINNTSVSCRGLSLFFSKKYIHCNASRTQTHQPATARDFVFSHTHTRHAALQPHRTAPREPCSLQRRRRRRTLVHTRSPQNPGIFQVSILVKMCLPTPRDQMSSFGCERSIRDSASEI